MQFFVPTCNFEKIDNFRLDNVMSSLWLMTSTTKAYLAGTHSSREHICATEYRQLVTTCTYGNFSWINLENLNFFSEIAIARTPAMPQLVGNGGLWEPHHTHYSPQYGDKGCRKIIITVAFCSKCLIRWRPTYLKSESSNIQTSTIQYSNGKKSLSQKVRPFE